MKIWNDLLDEVKKNLPDEIECRTKINAFKKCTYKIC